MEQSLIDLLDAGNVISRPLGVNYRLKASRKPNIRLYCLLVILWLDMIYNIAVGCIPTKYEEIILKLGDFSFYLLGKNRYYLTGACLAIRASSLVMVTIFFRDPGDWIREASDIFDHLKSFELCSRLTKLRKRCQLIALLCGTFLAVLTLLAQLMAYLINSARDSQYFLFPTYVYFVFYGIIYTYLNCQFMTTLYFLCRICIEVFREINQNYSLGHVFFNRNKRFKAYYWKFCQSCIFASHMLYYGRRIYITFAVCNMNIIVFCLYSALYTNSNVFLKGAFFGYIGLNLFLLSFLSYTIGLIDVKAKGLSDKIYEEFIIDKSNQITKKFYWKLHRYFQTVWSSVISMEVMDSPINSSTFIMIITILLMVFAFLVGNFHIG